MPGKTAEDLMLISVPEMADIAVMLASGTVKFVDGKKRRRRHAILKMPDKTAEDSMLLSGPEMGDIIVMLANGTVKTLPKT